MLRLTFVLPYPPSGNDSKTPYRGRLIRSRPSKLYRQLVKAAVLSAYPFSVQESGLPFPSGKLLVMRIFLLRKAARGDCDNAAKVLQDALQGLMYENDGQIEALHIERSIDRASPRVVVQLEEFVAEKYSVPMWVDYAFGGNPVPPSPIPTPRYERKRKAKAEKGMLVPNWASSRRESALGPSDGEVREMERRASDLRALAKPAVYRPR